MIHLIAVVILQINQKAVVSPRYRAPTDSPARFVGQLLIIFPGKIANPNLHHTVRVGLQVSDLLSVGRNLRGNVFGVPEEHGSWDYRWQLCKSDRTRQNKQGN